MTHEVTFREVAITGCFSGDNYLGSSVIDTKGEKIQWVLDKGTEKETVLYAIVPTDYFKEYIDNYPVVSARRSEFAQHPSGVFEQVKAFCVEYMGALLLLNTDGSSVLLGVLERCGHWNHCGLVPTDNYWDNVQYIPDDVAPFRLLRVENTVDDTEVKKVFQVFVNVNGKTVPKDIWSFSTVKGVSRYAKISEYINGTAWLETVSEELLCLIKPMTLKKPSCVSGPYSLG